MHILELKKMHGPENPFVYMCGLTKKKQFQQHVCSMQLMQGWYALKPDPYEEREVVVEAVAAWRGCNFDLS